MYRSALCCPVGRFDTVILSSFEKSLCRRRTDHPDNSHSEQDSSILEAQPSSEIQIIGLCTGLLPAAAAATARSTGELLQLAPNVICIALRLALEADIRSSQIEETTQSWAVIVPGFAASEQSALDDFHQQTVELTNPAIIIASLTCGRDCPSICTHTSVPKLNRPQR